MRNDIKESPWTIIRGGSWHKVSFSTSRCRIRFGKLAIMGVVAGSKLSLGPVDTRSTAGIRRPRSSNRVSWV